MAYRAELYEHDLDRQAADALNQFPKFVKLLESYSANYDEKAAKIDLLSTAIRLGENQMPEVYGLLPPICEQLGIDTPELYYVRDRQANAATFGSVHPCIYVTSGLVNKLPLNLLPSVLAHECGHIACKHRLNRELARVNQEVERYTNHADKADYAFAVASGVLAGLVDSLFVGEFSLEYANQWGNQQAEKLVLKVAKYQGYGGTDLGQAIKHLEDQFPIAADKATAAFGGGLQHHLRDFSHHPTPVGLVCSILTQFTGNVYGTDVAGAFQCVPLNKDGLNLVGKSFPEKIMFGAVNWFFHMVSDVAGSSGTVMKGSFGTGLPGPLVSLLKEFSSTRLFKKQDAKGYKEFSVYISKLFNGTLLGERDSKGNLIPLKFDLRTEMGVAMQVGKQTIPVIINECIVRSFFLLRRLLQELSRDDIKDWSDVHKINWKAIIPFRNRTVDRMLTIASMTFTVADTADAAIHAAIESGGNWVLFSGRFVTRFNYVGAGRAALSIVREVSNEKKEAQLIHEKMILSEAKAALFLKQLQEFKEQLDLKVSNYLAEDIEGFMSGFADMQQGLLTGDSDLVIRGNMTVQKVLGREPQFTNQKEFDALMESDAPLVL